MHGNGFVEPPAWSTFAPVFLERYRAAQVARVQRLDAIARAHLARHEEAREESDRPSFDTRPFPERQRVLQRRAFEAVMVVHRTMADPAFVDATIDPSPRDYGSLLSERPDLMNFAALGFARTVTAARVAIHVVRALLQRRSRGERRAHHRANARGGRGA